MPSVANSRMCIHLRRIAPPICMHGKLAIIAAFGQHVHRGDWHDGPRGESAERARDHRCDPALETALHILCGYCGWPGSEQRRCRYLRCDSRLQLRQTCRRFSAARQLDLQDFNLGLLNGANAYALRPIWRERLQSSPPVASTPTVIAGEVASGDQVVDDPTNAFFAAVLKRWPKIKAVEMEGAGASAAIEQAQAYGFPVGFMMIRGISDVPRPGKLMRPKAPSSATTGSPLPLRPPPRLPWG